MLAHFVTALQRVDATVTQSRAPPTPKVGSCTLGLALHHSGCAAYSQKSRFQGQGKPPQPTVFRSSKP